MPYVVVTTFNPWLVQGRDELFASFFKQLRSALGESPLKRVRDVVGNLAKYESAFKVGISVGAVAADCMGASGTASAVAKGVSKGLTPMSKTTVRSPLEERRTLEKKLKQAKVAVVVLIDELDRVDDEDVRAVAQLVKAVGDIEGISYLVAYDPDRVSDALGRGADEKRRQYGEAYLEKIIQHPIPVRPLLSHDVSSLLTSILSLHGLELPSSLTDDEKQIIEHIRRSVTTPREVKRLVGCYSVISRMVRSEVSAADLLGYCWLLTKAPTVRDAIAANPDLVVDDPGEDELIRRVSVQASSSAPEIAEALNVKVGSHERLLKLLFPHFGASRALDLGDRLSRRRNLIRVLYLGDPPGIVRNDEVFALWAESDESRLTAALTRLHDERLLRQVIERLDDLLPTLPESGDSRFFRALARALIRRTDWFFEPEENRAIAEDAASYLMQLGLRNRKMVTRVKAVLDELAKVGDLVLLPFILRKHLFLWNFPNSDKISGHGDFVFDRNETIELLDRSAPFLRKAVIDGTLLRRMPTSEAIFTLSRADMWNDELRAALTEQLMGLEARRSFAALIVPPGYIIDAATLNRLLDVQPVLEVMSKAKEGHQPKTWSDNCLRRLRYVLLGKDPTFITDEDDDL
jgi:hypothetical protein